MWRGPTWNSITMWVAAGCLRYCRADAATAILGRALDCSAAVFARTGTIWEFYHPQGGEPTALTRKPQTPFNKPCRDYLGHNPLWMMARLYAAACW
jgi:putative isomerase